MTGDKTENKNSYDELPYQGHAAMRSHTTRLATLGTLFGMQPEAVENCRVLELGCAEGGNLLPMAIDYPHSEFVGVDYSARQISDGNSAISQLGLNNIRLMHKNILDVDESFGTFDYIIVHGILSWIPADVRPKIFEVCKQNLNPQGIAFVSYNANPGGHLRGMVREMLLYHIRNIDDVSVRVSEARQLLDFLVDSVGDKNEMYRAALAWEQGHTQPLSDQHFRHDLLEDVHQAFYFHEVAEMAAARGLQYLADANFETMLPRNFKPEVFERLKGMSNHLIEIEQYMDFVRNRTFRETLLCHENVALERGIGANCLKNIYVASSMRPQSPHPEIAGRKQEIFFNARGGELKNSDPITKAAVLIMTEIWPDNISFQSLVHEARARLQKESRSDANLCSKTDDVTTLANALLECFAGGLVEISLRPASCTAKIDDYPQAGLWSRMQALTGESITNLRHELVKIDMLPRLVLCHLDGNRNRESLLEALIDHTINEKISIEVNGQPATDREQIRSVLSGRLDSSLHDLSRAALLLKKAG